jgi:hypothetical protein
MLTDGYACTRPPPPPPPHIAFFIQRGRSKVSACLQSVSVCTHIHSFFSSTLVMDCHRRVYCMWLAHQYSDKFSVIQRRLKPFCWGHLSSKVKKRLKVKLSPCLAKHTTPRSYWASGGVAPLILDLSTVWSWVVSFMLRPLYPWSPIGGLDAVEKGKSPCPFWESNPRLPDRSLVAVLSGSPRLLRHLKGKGKVIPVIFLNWVPRHEGVLGSGGIAPRILWPR